MKKMNLWIVLIAGFAILYSDGYLHGQDWPQWRGTNRDGKVNGFTAPQDWPAQLTQKWKTTVGFGDATPALVNNKLYVFTRQGEEEITLCLNANDGTELWRDKYVAQAVSGPASRHPGPRSSPTVANGKVITLGVGGVISCLDAATGKVLWRKDEFPKKVPRFFAAMSPIVTDGICIAHLGGSDTGAVIAFDLANGNHKWKWAGDGPAYSSPVLMTVEGTKQVVIQGEKNLVGLGLADGKLLWEIPTSVERRFYNSATPIVDGKTIIYTGQGTGTRAVKIEKQAENFTVKELWSNKEVGTGFNTPVLKNDLLFGLSGQRYLFCIDAKTGKTMWIDTNRLDQFSSILDVGSILLALPNTAELIVFKPSDKQYEEVTRIKVSETETYAHPVIAGNQIFVKDQETLTMFSLK